MEEQNVANVILKALLAAQFLFLSRKKMHINHFESIIKSI